VIWLRRDEGVNRRKVVLTLILYTLIWASYWQLDLICSPLVWSLKPPKDIFLLPFNIPIHVTLAYCLFYGIMIVSTFMLCLMSLVDISRYLIAAYKARGNRKP